MNNADYPGRNGDGTPCPRNRISGYYSDLDAKNRTAAQQQTNQKPPAITPEDIEKYNVQPPPQNGLSENADNRTYHALVLAAIIAIGSMVGNYVQALKISKDEETQQSLITRLENSYHRNDELTKELFNEQSALRRAEFTTSIQKIDINKLMNRLQHYETLEAQRTLPQNSNLLTDNTDDSGGSDSQKIAGIND